MYVVTYCSLTRSARLICIARSWKFHFDLLAVVERRLQICLNVFQGQAAGPTEDGCAVTRSSCWEATIDCDFLHDFCIISCVKRTLLPFHVLFRVPAFRLSQLPEAERMSLKCFLQLYLSVNILFSHQFQLHLTGQFYLPSVNTYALNYDFNASRSSWLVFQPNIISSQDSH